jgi:hypothetical protein
VERGVVKKEEKATKKKKINRRQICGHMGAFHA